MNDLLFTLEMFFLECLAVLDLLEASAIMRWFLSVIFLPC